MINFLHIICKIGMAFWTFICGVLGVCTFIGMLATPSPGVDHSAAGVASFFGLLFIGAIWFFPVLTMAIAAYFTRPQAWAEPSKPAQITPAGG